MRIGSGFWLFGASLMNNIIPRGSPWSSEIRPTSGKEREQPRERKTAENTALAAVAGIDGKQGEMGDKGLETPFKSPEKQRMEDGGGAKSGALPPGLLEIIQSWETLTAADRAAVLAVVRARSASGAGAERQGTGESRNSSTSAAAGGLTSCRAGRGAAFGRGAPGGLPRRSGRAASPSIQGKTP